MSSILVVDDNREVAAFCCQLFAEAGHEATGVYSGEEALRLLRDHAFDIVVSDISMPGLSGLELLPLAKAAPSAPDVILITGYASVRDAVSAVKQGAYDYIEKPIDPDQLLELARQLGDLRTRRSETREISLEEARDTYGIVGASPSTKALLAWIAQVSGRSQPVLIRGEHGTGKQLVARAIHRQSPRANLPFVIVRDVLPDISQAGTIFLDELSRLPDATQARLYRDLQERRIQAHVVASSSANLEAAMQTGTLREDLYHRLNVHSIELAPLRDRRQDIPILASYFLGSHVEGGRYSVSTEVLATFQEYDWPGNVRELENCIIAMLAHAGGPVLGTGLLPGPLQNFASHTSTRGPLEAAERTALVQTLQQVNGRVGEAAAKLGVSQATLYRKLAANGLRATDFRSPRPPEGPGNARATGSH